MGNGTITRGALRWPGRSGSSVSVHGCFALALLLTGCGFKSPQGYGVAEQSTAVQAQQEMEKAELSTQVDPAKTYLNLITQMQQANQWYASLAHTESFERQYGGSEQVRLLRADALRNTNQPAQAEKEYRALLGAADSSTLARVQRGLGLLHAGQRKYEQAIVHLEIARQLNPIDADILGDLAYAHMLDGRLSAASLPIFQAAQLAPSNARVQLNLALYWLASGEQDQAAQLLRRLSQPQPKNTPPMINEASLNQLKSQLLMVQQAVRARADASFAPAPAVEPLDEQPPKTQPPASVMRTVVISGEPGPHHTLSHTAERPREPAAASQPAPGTTADATPLAVDANQAITN